MVRRRGRDIPVPRGRSVCRPAQASSRLGDPPPCMREDHRLRSEPRTEVSITHRRCHGNIRNDVRPNGRAPRPGRADTQDRPWSSGLRPASGRRAPTPGPAAGTEGHAHGKGRAAERRTAAFQDTAAGPTGPGVRGPLGRLRARCVLAGKRGPDATPGTPVLQGGFSGQAARGSGRAWRGVWLGPP